MAEVVKKPLKITETVLRDAHQSLIATRMTTEQMLPIVDKMDKVGYYAVVGRIRHTTTVTTIGNKIFSSLDTGRKFCILIARSFFVVNNFIIGG